MEALTENPVVGALGLPLGTVVEIRGNVISGDELRLKAYAGTYLLRVKEVGGRARVPPAVMEFSAPFVASLPSDPFELYESKTGSKPDGLDSAQIKQLEKGYVGKQVRLVVYETGGYSGIPRKLPADAPTWQDRDFGFRTSLVVLAERP
jgi:hypothetical protein